MNETKHTSGPWIMHSGAVYKPDGTEDGYPIAHMDRNTPKTMPCERDANARLIAAAPDLLEACKSALDAIHEEKMLQAKRGESVHYFIGTAQDFLEKAITKATGGAA